MSQVMEQESATPVVLHGIPGWARGTIYSCGGAAAAAIQLGSSWSLGSLAYQAGLGWPRLLLLPIALDLGAIVAATLWVAGHGRHRTTGRWATIGLVMSSISFNAADALAAHQKLHPDQLLVISVAIAMIFPLTAALMGHIVLVVRESDSTAAAERARVREEQERAERERLERLRVEAEAKAAKAAKEEARKMPKAAKAAASAMLLDKVKAELTQAWEQGRSMTGTEAALKVGVSDSYGRRVARELKEQGIVPPRQKLAEQPRLALASRR